MDFHLAETCTDINPSTLSNLTLLTLSIGLECLMLIPMPLTTSSTQTLETRRLRSLKSTLEATSISSSSLVSSQMTLSRHTQSLLVTRLFHLYGLSDGINADSVMSLTKTGWMFTTTTLLRASLSMLCGQILTTWMTTNSSQSLT